MVLMKDIADAVGVSKATVSLVLNGHCGSRVSAKVRQKVLDAAHQMGYQGNDLARSLRTGKTNLISVIVTDISNDFFGKMSFYIQEEAKKYGYLVITANTNESDTELESIVKVLVGKKVDGIIAVPTNNCLDALNKIIEKGIPLVQIDRFVDGVNSNYVGTDNYNSAFDAVDKLVSSGKKKIAMLTLNLKVNAIQQRCEAYVNVLKKRGLYRKELIKEISQEDKEANTITIKQLLSENPDAVFCSSRRCFISLMECLSIIPAAQKENISYLCFDESKSYKAMLEGNLWYVEQPVEQMAKKAFSLLLDTIKGSKECSKIEFPSTLVI